MAGEEQWRRFEREARGGSKFWAIRVERSRCLLRHGVVDEGAEPVHKVLEFESQAEARAQHKKRVRTKLRAGWVEVEVGADDPTAAEGAALEAQLREAIASEVGDLDAWMVYGDFLAERSVIVGERLALGVALEQAQDRRARRRIEGRIQQLESAHARELLGPTIAGLLSDRRYEGAIELERRFGMIVGAQIHDRAGLDWRFEAVVASLLELDAASVLRELGIHGGARSGPFVAALELLRGRPPPTLAGLSLDFSQAENTVEWRRGGGSREQIRLPPPARITAGLPALERLELLGPFALESWRHPRLRELCLRRVGVVAGVSLAGCELPALERLQLADPFGIEGWSEAELPALRELLINVPGRLPMQIAALMESTIVEELDSLVLVASSLGETGVELLCDHARRLAGLARLVLVDPPPRPRLLDPLARSSLPVEVLRHGRPPRNRSARVLVDYGFDGGLAAG